MDSLDIFTADEIESEAPAQPHLELPDRKSDPTVGKFGEKEPLFSSCRSGAKQG